MNENNNGGAGIGFLGFLGLTFIILKLCKVIDWQWIWVLAPIWGGIVLTVIIALVIVIWYK